MADAPDLGSGAEGRMSSSLIVRTRQQRNRVFAGVAHLVERRLAKAEVAGSSPVSRSILYPDTGWSDLKGVCTRALSAAKAFSYRQLGKPEHSEGSC